MKKISIAVLAFSGMLILDSCGTQKQATTETTPIPIEELKPAELPENGIAIELMDKSVRPQDDFYNYVNGTWMKTAQIPADKASWGSFNELREKTDLNSLKILDNLLKETYAKGTEGQKIQDIYATYMDMDKRNADGIAPIKGDLAKIDAIKTMADLQKYLVEATKTGDNPFYSWGVYADLKNSTDNAVYMGDVNLGLGRDYYQKDNEENTKTIGQYKDYLTKLYTVLGYKNPEVAAQKVIDFEKTAAQTLIPNEKIRDANLQYNPKTLPELKTLVKNVDLPSYLKNAGVNTDRVIIGELDYYKNLDKFLNAKNLPFIKDFLKVKLLNGSASVLDQKLDDLQFDFYGRTLSGQKEQRAMNKRALSTINGVLGEAFGKLYVDKYFSAEAKAEMVTLIDYLKKSYVQHISNLSWMSDETKTKALDKLSKFTVKVGYPDEWKDYSKLQVLSKNEGGTLYGNLKNVSFWAYQKELDKVGKKVDKKEWGMTPQTVNAYYNPVNNEIVFPAAILQAPFFDFKADPAVNFGGIGAVIGHEISHGFDDSGAMFDGDGNLKNWWTDADKKNFEEATKKLAEQYSKYEPVKGTFVNGLFTNGENIADLGGVAIAYDALQMYLKDKGNPGLISGYNQDQRFFLSWGTIWRTKSTEKYMINQVKTDPHSPGLYRAFGPLVNTESWYKAFEVKEGDQHYKKPEDRIKIW
ncbi:M13 family metallopeptidase [Cloacibacterium sp. TD35]|uniref:M13 family metallopeptidase n=1 Tax=Cloacibacterium sp. TD35 TaxID=2976818 RepID=UPI00237D8BEB|nr:M13 family metallopeptidase [Cloacibacterium sp. TD35]WDT66923.1 M13 family metallopeptidase [Cloacibacterium sp. TD35]